MDIQPMLNIGKGEEIAMMCISGLLPQNGYYKFLAKRKADGKYEWVHFIERLDKRKENVYRGDVKGENELKQVLEIMNRNLIKFFGSAAEMKPGKADIYTTDGKPLLE